MQMTETQKKLADALCIILDSLEANERKVREKPLAASFSLMNLSQLEESIDRGEEYVSDPIGQVLRDGVTTLGELLAKNSKSADEMEAICEYCAGDGQNATWRSMIIDKRWDGIPLPPNGFPWTA